VYRVKLLDRGRRCGLSTERGLTGRSWSPWCVCVCVRVSELKDQPCLTNSEINHTLRSYFGALRRDVYGWRGDTKEISRFSVCVQDRWKKAEGQIIYLTKCNAPLYTQNIFENTSLRITKTFTERMLTKVQHLRSEVLAAVLLTVQVFWDMTPCQWVINSPLFEGKVLLYFEGHVAWHCFTRRLLFSETHRTNKQTNKSRTNSEAHVSVRG
jgi:hypothetical protein